MTSAHGQPISRMARPLYIHSFHPAPNSSGGRTATSAGRTGEALRRLQRQPRKTLRIGHRCPVCLIDNEVFEYVAADEPLTFR